MTFATNRLYGSKLHDMETCYKLIDRALLQSLQLESRGFEIEAEITAKLLNSGVKIYEAPIQYDHREEGKKLTLWDGAPTLKALWKYRAFAQFVFPPLNALHAKSGEPDRTCFAPAFSSPLLSSATSPSAAPIRLIGQSPARRPR